MSWKKVVVSGSNAHLSTIGVGTAAAPSTAGHISASGKLLQKHKIQMEDYLLLM